MKIKPSLPLDVISPGPVPGRKTFFFFLTLLGFLIHPSLIALRVKVQWWPIMNLEGSGGGPTFFKVGLIFTLFSVT